MKYFIVPCLLLCSLEVFSQGVMPVPMESTSYIFAPSCNQDQQFQILSDPMQKAFNLDLTSLLCKEDSLYADAFEYGANYQHDRARCDEISYCSGTVKNDDVKDAEALVSQNIPTAVLLSALTKAVEENREYNVALYQYEQKHKTKLCADEQIDFDCDHKTRVALAAVADSLIDFPEFDRAPASADNLLSFIPDKFFSKESVMVKSEEELKKDCSKKFSLQKVCVKARERINIVSECDRGTVGRNCFEDEQRAWASLTNDFRNNNKDLYLAIEKQLCQPQRIIKSSTQKPFARTRPHIFKPGSQFRAQSSTIRTSQLMSTAKLNAETSARPESTTPSQKDVKAQEEFKFGEGLRTATQAIAVKKNSSEDVIHGFENRDSLVDSFGDNLQKVSENFKVPENRINTNTTANWDVIGRAREIAEEERIKAEDLKNKAKEDDKVVAKEESEKKKEEADTLLAQINNLKSKLEDMNEKMEELQGKKESSESKTASQDSSATEKQILELKKTIAELEADKKRKEAEASALKTMEENRLAKEREEKVRNFVSAPTSFTTSRPNAAQAAQSEAAAVAAESEKASRNLAASYAGSENSRGPASVSTNSSSSGSQSNQLVLKSIGTQATPESNVVYMTANELQRYPYRLGEQASPVEIEKMLEGNQGSTIIIGNSEQIVPVVENGKVVLDENGKVKYKRVKIALVKNDKERKMQIEREISSVADLKKEEQKKRDLIRYQEMKKALKVK